MKQGHQQMEFIFMNRLMNLGQTRGWSMTPEYFVLGLQCRVSDIHDALLMLDKQKPISGQINMAQTLTAVADVAIYLLHLQSFIRNAQRGWADSGMACVSPIASRPRPVSDTGH